VHEATVARVAPLAKTKGWGSPVRYFETTLALAKTDPATMKPGERVRATIRLEEIDDVRAIPRGALFEKDGERVVYRREGGGWAAVPVTVGRQSISRVVVEGGLEDGDRIALRDPTEKAARVFGKGKGKGEGEPAATPEAGP
jgi:HlyD family secretion protein